MTGRAPDDLVAELARRAARRDVETWQPRCFDLVRAADRRALAALLKRGAVVECCDAYDRQLAELVRERHPAEVLDFDAARARAEPLLEGQPPPLHGRWVFYPWSGRLVHVLPPDEFRELRSMRNRDKITAEEQARLRRAVIGVVGLSVGRAAAATLALEGVGGEIRLADPDVLDLTNLNRLRTGVHALGVNKTVLAARELAEIDPYLTVRIFPEGLNDETLDAFLTEGGRLDLLVEECDDIYMKFRVRERCRALGIPVVMETSDRGLIDVERFDLEPDRPLFHGLAGDVRAADLRDAPREVVLDLVGRIVGRDAVSPRMKASLAALGSTLRTWPQLASDVALGGATATLVARRILLGQMTASGRFYVDPERATETPVPESGRSSPATTEEGSMRDSSGRTVGGAGEARPTDPIDSTTIRRILEAGIRAPTAHNAQPWRFRIDGHRIECRRDETRCFRHLDFENGATHVGFGTLIENVALEAATLGIRADVDLFPRADDPRLVCVIHLVRDPAVEAEPALAAEIPRRCSNRRKGRRRPLSDAERAALTEAIAPTKARLALATEPADLRTLARLVGKVDRITFSHPDIHRDIFEGLRWSPEEVRAHVHGLDVATLELAPPERAVVKLLSRPGAVRLLNRIGAGPMLEMGGRQMVATASAMGLLTYPGTTPESYVEGGRALERLWLAASRAGLGLVPLASLPYRFAHLERGGGAGLAPEHVAELRAMREPYRAIFRPPEGHAEIMLFRLAHAPEPTARSVRHALDDLLD